MSNTFRYGGQAVMEGVMMRGQRNLAIVVRRPDGTLAKQVKPLSAIYTGPLRRLPFVRGVIALLEALILGMQSLMFSTSVALDDEEKHEADQPADGGKGMGAAIWVTLLISIALAVGLFFLLPLFLTRWILPNDASSLLFHFAEGMVRLVIFLAYLSLVSLMPDIRRVFAYHGAEHKTIHAYEAGVPLQPKDIQTFTTAHARCGTAFLLAVMIIAILVFSLIGKPGLWLMVASRILLVPVIAAFAYELTQLGARHLGNPMVRAVMAPGLWLQSLTTKQPDDKMVEVSIAALEEVLIADGVLTRIESASTNPLS
ncbi:MAG: DUF1385 domain-containing protein [Dehalococcoidia bacterium]|nr:DUF1385 domain-containing protein [Dehalococcoidia bacterium]